MTSRRYQALCMNLCSYYKPGRNEELACRGYLVAERMMQQGRQFSFEPGGALPSGTVAAALVTHLCSRCDFRVGGCDFAEDGRSVPCGGFVLLARLLAEGTVTEKDLEVP